jgi:osmoprotectant transport system permease protein
MTSFLKIIFYMMLISLFPYTINKCRGGSRTASTPVTPQADKTISIGAKNFNEGYLLSEILAQLFESNGFQIDRKYNLGGTLICFEALKNGEIDIYPEYTGTISEQILQSDLTFTLEELRKHMGEHYGLKISQPYGFNNTYALAVTKKTAEQYGLQRISDLRSHPELRFAFSYEFIERKDGWQNLAAAYNLPQSPVGIEHGLSYQAIEKNKVDLIDIYSTDGEVLRYDLKILEDDRKFFPIYLAVALYRSTLPVEAVRLVGKLNNVIDEEKMQKFNARVVFDEEPYEQVAKSFLKSINLFSGNEKNNQNYYLDILDKTLVHLQLTGIALFAAILLAIPLGILIYHYSAVAKPILYLAGLLQTIPSIALLALMIPLFGIGVLPAIIALFLYALLPILRNTATALFSIDPLLKKVATGIGLTSWQRLRFIEFPLSTPTIFAGIKTAAIISIGTATLAAFIGAGGLGEFIVTGLALNNASMILKGAIPAAVLAILVEFLFEMIEKWFVPKHLQQKIGK